MTSRVFGMDDQLAFAGLSGDYNPLHVDAVAARRLIYGRPVVHGIHLLLWALDGWLGESTGSVVARELTLILKKAVGVDEPVTRDVAREIEGGVELVLRAAGAECALIKLTWAAPSNDQYDGIADALLPPAAPCALTMDEVRTAAGSLDLVFAPERGRALFPHLVRRLPAAQIAMLLATTRLVGMRCPGLHSVYSELRVMSGDHASQAPQLRYTFKSCHARLQLVTMEVAGAGLQGTIRAFLRPPPREQARYATLRELVDSGEFRGQRALVIGGSRGLGEVTAKLLAAGGAEVRITWHRGAADAQRVVADIRDGGGRVDSMAWDVLDPQAVLPDDWRPTHLYYFATPPISSGARGRFSLAGFRRFCDAYVDGLINTFTAAGGDAHGLRGLLYPSSIFVDEVPADMGEYVAAKAAGEVVCRLLAHSHPETRICAPRLPRTATDQTASLLPVRTVDPAALMLEHLRWLAGDQPAPSTT